MMSLQVCLVFFVLCLSATGISAAVECRPKFPGYFLQSGFDALVVGCYHSKAGNRVFPPDQSMVSLQADIDTKTWDKVEHGRSMVQKCGQLAMKNGATHFGVESLGDCYYGSSPDFSPAKVTDVDGCDKFCKYDLGGAGAMVVYEIKPTNFKPVCKPEHLGYNIDGQSWAINRGCYYGDWTKGGVLPKGTHVNFKLTINWQPWLTKGYGDDVIENCGKIALKRGAKYFGIQYYGDCYTGDNPNVSQGEVTAECRRSCIWDVGSLQTMNVYEIKAKVK